LSASIVAALPTSIEGVERSHLEERVVDTVDNIAGDPLVGGGS